jgi:3-phosphoglycerate kinase
MNYNKKTIRDFDPKGKKILLRCDFNVPLDKQTGAITSDKRIRASLPTIRSLLEKGAAVIACSHLGKPKGEWKPELSLKPVAARLSELLGMPVKMAADVVGESAKTLAAELKPGEIMLLENTRYHIGETKNDPEFAKDLASMAEIFVSDAFGAVHRAHASTAGIAAYLPAYAGLLVEKEISVMGKALSEPKRPFLAILGGAKVGDKIPVIENLLDKADIIIIGGGMAYTFEKALGLEIGKSLLEEDKMEFAKEMIDKAAQKGVMLLLPVDIVIGKEFEKDTEYRVVKRGEIPADWMGMDIGPESVKLFESVIQTAETIIWNGPMGVFEFPNFANGTKAVAKAVADSYSNSIVGGGDSVAAVEKMGFADKIKHISTGGGASLEFLEGKDLPGVACLLDA